MADHKFKVGEKVVIYPDNGYSEWRGMTGTISVLEEIYIRVELDTKPRHWTYSFVRTRESWLRPLKPLSELEQQIAAYVKAEMAQLGVS